MIKLKELFDSGNNVEIKKSGLMYNFSILNKDGEDVNYEVKIFPVPNFKKSELELETFLEVFTGKIVAFGVENKKSGIKFGLENNSYAAMVFSIVWRIMKEDFNASRCDLFIFSADETEASRIKLYDSFAKMIDKKTDWKYIDNKNMHSQKYYIFVKKELEDFYNTGK